MLSLGFCNHWTMKIYYFQNYLCLKIKKEIKGSQSTANEKEFDELFDLWYRRFRIKFLMEAEEMESSKQARLRKLKKIFLISSKALLKVSVLLKRAEI